MIHCGDKLRLAYPAEDYYGVEEHLEVLSTCLTPYSKTPYYRVHIHETDVWLPATEFNFLSKIDRRGTVWNRIMKSLKRALADT
jgi:hypothetical protein